MSGQRQIPRRTVLRGLGITISLPLLEAMLPESRAADRQSDRPPVRMALLYVPNGMHMPAWTPEKTGADFEIPPTLEPLTKFQSEMTVLSGLTLNGARALGDGPGDHARSVAAFLTGAHPKKTDGADIYNGVSVDQLAARKIGMQTKLPSLELGIDRSAKAGRCDSGYSCVYTSNMCWRSPTSPVAKEVDPAAVFDRLFGNPLNNQSLAERSKQDRYRTSVLDLVLEDANTLQNKLGVTDRQKLDEYLYAVREIERRIVNVRRMRNAEADVPDYERPVGIPREFGVHTQLMFDLMTLAMQTAATRILTFMFANAGSNRSYPQIDVREGHHHLSHHGRDAKKQEKIAHINRYHVQLFRYLIEKLAATKEGEGTLLDNSMVMYGSGIGDGNRHNHDDLPILLLGRGGGSIRSGRHLVYARNTPLTNLYRAMLERMDIAVDQFGDSTGVLNDLG